MSSDLVRFSMTAAERAASDVRTKARLQAGEAKSEAVAAAWNLKYAQNSALLCDADVVRAAALMLDEIKSDGYRMVPSTRACFQFLLACKDVGFFMSKAFDYARAKAFMIQACEAIVHRSGLTAMLKKVKLPVKHSAETDTPWSACFTTLLRLSADPNFN